MSLLKKNVITTAHDDGRSAATRFMEEHENLNREVLLLTDENRSLKADLAAATAEIQMLRDELERTMKARNILQAFTVGIVTRMTVIKETIDFAVREAAAHRIEPAEEESVEAAKKEVAEAKEIVGRLGKLAVADELERAINGIPKNQN